MSNVKSNTKDLEICAECGRNVARGSGWFVNRVVIFDDFAERREMGRPYPQGAFVCAVCDEARDEELIAEDADEEAA